MPIYEYLCRRWGNPHRFELMFPIGKAPESLPCEECYNAADMVISRPAIAKIANPFTKDGEGFTSVSYEPSEYRYRVKNNMGKYDT